MKAKHLLLLGGAIAIPVAGYSYYRYIINRFALSLNNVSIVSIDTEKKLLVARVEFLVDNTTGLEIQVLSNDLYIYANGMPVGMAKQANPVVVPNNTRTVINMDVTISTSTVTNTAASYLWDLVVGNNSGIYLNLVGNSRIKVNAPLVGLFKIDIPIRENYEL